MRVVDIGCVEPRWASLAHRVTLALIILYPYSAITVLVAGWLYPLVRYLRQSGRQDPIFALATWCIVP